MTHYLYSRSREGWEGFEHNVRQRIIQSGARTVAELGAGANPLLSLNFVRDVGFRYICIDVSGEELAKAPCEYTKIIQDIGARDCTISGEVDLVFSKMLVEHVPFADVMHRNIFQMLRPGGFAIHFFPTLFAPPFVLNYLAPESLSRWLVSKFQPQRDIGGRQSKFPAYYRWCRGPTQRQVSRFTRVGFEVVEYHGFFGHDGYYRRLGPILWFHRKLCDWLVAHPVAHLTSYSFVVLQKP